MKRMILAAVVVLGVTVGVGVSTALPAATGAQAAGCKLRGDYKHVIYVQFDNTHLVRDNPNVPSDLEQMPNLLNFLKGNGVLMSNHHTSLISHTATGILSSLTGVYPDRMGQAVSNSYRYFNGRVEQHRCVVRVLDVTCLRPCRPRDGHRPRRW